MNKDRQYEDMLCRTINNLRTLEEEATTVEEKYCLDVARIYLEMINDGECDNE